MAKKRVKIEKSIKFEDLRSSHDLADRPFAFDHKAEIVQNKQGGKQSKLELRYDLIDAIAMKRMARILDHGAKKYGEQNWRKISKRDNINRAIYHLYQYLELLDDPTRIDKEDKTLRELEEDKLGHALCRVMFAVALDK